MTDKRRSGVVESQTFHGGNPSLRPEGCCRYSIQRAFFLSAGSSPFPTAPKQVNEAAPMRKSYRGLRGSPTQKGHRAKHRVPRRWLDAALATNALRSFAPVPPHVNAHWVCSTVTESGVISGLNPAPS